MRIQLLFLLMCSASYGADIAFLAHPRGPTGEWFPTQSLSELDGGYKFHPGSQLIVRSGSGEERVLVNGSVLDFSVSQDGKALFVSIVENNRSDIYRVDVSSGEKTKITNGPGWNCQPMEHRDWIVFLSNRDQWQNPHEGYTAFGLYRMNKQGGQQERIWHAGIGGVFGISLGPSGRVYFASGENQGFRGGGGTAWSIWSVNPDGSDFQPEMSNIVRQQSPLDWPVITSDGSLVVSMYYDTRVYGTIFAAPKIGSGPFDPPTHFGHPLFPAAPLLRNGYDRSGGGEVGMKFAWQRRGMYSLVPFATTMDYLAHRAGQPTGMYSHPWPIPGNGVYLTWTGKNGDDQMDLGVYAWPDATKAADDFTSLTKVADEPTRHEWMGKQVVPFKVIYGDEIQVPTKNISDLLPLGSPFGVIGTSSVTHHEWAEQNGLPSEAHMITMGPDEAEYVRILSFNPNTKRIGRLPPILNGNTASNMPSRATRSWNLEGYSSEINERTGFYEQLIPIKKWRKVDGKLHLGPSPPTGATRIMRSDGQPDTSWQAIVPANQAWSIQLLRANQEAVPSSTAQTWHQVVPRERRTNCQGCHAHWKPDPILFDETFAATQEYRAHIKRLDKVKRVVYQRDIEPLKLNIPMRPWDQINPYYMTYLSGAQNLDDNAAWTEEQRQLVSAWQDTGFMAAGTLADGSTITAESGLGPYQDTMEPTVAVEENNGQPVIGAFDPDSGVASVVMALNGQDVSAKFSPDTNEHTYATAESMQGTLVVTAKDKHGNKTTIERVLGVNPEPEPEPEPEPRIVDWLRPGDHLEVGQSRTSINGRFKLIYQTDGNLVLYEAPSRPVWSTNTFDVPGRVVMQNDGNLVMYAGDRAYGQPTLAVRTAPLLVLGMTVG